MEVRGRARALQVNYRTSHQIRTQADRQLGPEVADVDGNVEVRVYTVSVFNGPAPDNRVLDDTQAEIDAVASWLRARHEDGVAPQEMAVFVRSPAEIDRALYAVQAAGVEPNVLDERVDTLSGRVSVSTMHLAKGLEFRAVAVMACDDEVIPLQGRIETVGDDADLEEVYTSSATCSMSPAPGPGTI